MNQILEQIKEDIGLIQENFMYLDERLKQTHYAFNYWILSKLYNLDEEIIKENICDGSGDKGADCFVHYEDSKELHIIQSKYYDENIVNTKELLYFLSILTFLKEDSYKKNENLQDIFNKAIKDNEYKIYFSFYISNDRKNADFEKHLKDFNDKNQNDGIYSEVFYLEDISERYFGERYKNEKKLTCKIVTKNKGTILQAKEEYGLDMPVEFFCVLTPILELYKMLKQAKENNYNIFDENIREYLGVNGKINRHIIETLKDKEKRADFFYYNNGITIICDESPKGQTVNNGREITLVNPQIINGCQTVNSIYEVLSCEQDIEINFKNVYVMTKIVIRDEKKKDNKFYKDIVKYNNSQNAIKDLFFGSREKLFFNLKEDLKDRGFLLLVKPSDRNTFNEILKSEGEKNTFTKKAERYFNKLDMDFKKDDLIIDLEKLLQIYLAIKEDGSFAFVKKANVLKRNSEVYEKYSKNIYEHLTTDNILFLYLLYKKAENNRKKSEDQRSPIPYYLIGFLGYFIKKSEQGDITKEILDTLFDRKEILIKVYDYLVRLTKLYKKTYFEDKKIEYNTMIKQKIDYGILDKTLENLNISHDIKNSNPLNHFLHL